MRTSVILTLVLGLGLAIASAPTSDTPAPERVKFYYGLPGSEDYVLGTTGPSIPGDAWQLHSNMPDLLMDLACARNETHVYVVSGYNSAHPRGLYRCPVGGTTWETMAQPPQEICNGGCAIIGDTFYYCAGYSYAGTGATVDTLWKYSISGNNWTSGSGPFTGTTYNWQPMIMACAGKLYYMSGCNQPGATNPSVETWRYDPATGAWTQVASMNQGSVFAAAWVYNDTIWFVGGNYNGTEIARTEFYDPVADDWIIDNAVFPQIPYAIWGCGSGVSGNTGFVAGGVRAGGLIDSIAYFDHSSRTWTVEEPLYLRVYRTAGVGTPDGKAILTGGSTGGFTPTNVCQYEQLATGNAHDVGVTQILAPAGSIRPDPVAPRGMIKNFGENPESDIPVTCWIDSAGTRVYDHTVTHTGPLAPGASAEVTFTPDWTGTDGYVYDVTMYTNLGNDENRSNDTLTGRVSVVSRTIIEWINRTMIRPCPVSRLEAICEPGADGPKLHVICGNCQTHTSHPNDEIYDIDANTWSTGLAHPAGGALGVHNHDATRIGNVIWVGGGSSSSGYYNNLTKLDLGAGTWTSATAMPTSNLLYYSMAAYPDSGWVYCFGGAPSGGNPIQACSRYSTATNQWTAMANMPAVRRNPFAVTVGDTIYVIGGMQTSGYTDTRGTVWKYSVLSNTWTQMTDTMPDNLGWGAAAYYYEPFGASAIYLWGGYRRGTVVNACWRYDVTSGTWTEETPMLRANRSHGGDVYDNYLWSAGGWSNSIFAFVDRGWIARTGVEEGKPSVNVGSSVAKPQTIVRDLARISYVLNKRAQVSLGIYDTKGSLVRTLIDGTFESGRHTALWDRTDSNGRRVASGTYFYRISIDGQKTSTKAVVLN